jgi:hypothetical protein
MPRDEPVKLCLSGQLDWVEYKEICIECQGQQNLTFILKEVEKNVGNDYI